MPAAPPAPPLLEVSGLHKEFPSNGGLLGFTRHEPIRAVRGVSFELARGETLGLVGESGCGKSTTGRIVARLLEPTAGTVRLAGDDVTSLRGEELRRLRRSVQVIFQDPYGSLDPRFRVRNAVSEPLKAHEWGTAAERKARVAELLDLVGLPQSYASRAPHELSGGQRQRVAIARAIAVNPSLVICDEPVSALDVSIRAQVINLLEDIQDRLGLSYLFIAHDLGLVHHISDRIAVMYLGRIVEVGPADDVYLNPRHPYTRALIASEPQLHRPLSTKRLEGEIPSAADPPAGCSFHTRCPFAAEICRTVDPPLRPIGSETSVACHLVETLPSA